MIYKHYGLKYIKLDEEDLKNNIDLSKQFCTIIITNNKDHPRLEYIKNNSREVYIVPSQEEYERIISNLGNVQYEFFDDDHLWRRVEINETSWNGEYREYYKSGQLRVHCFYINDIEDGEYRAYHENGQLNVLAYYENQKLNGKYIEYSEDGSIIKKAIFKDGQILL